MKVTKRKNKMYLGEYEVRYLPSGRFAAFLPNARPEARSIRELRKLIRALA